MQKTRTNTVTSESDSIHSDVNKESEPTSTIKDENTFRGLLFLAQFDIQHMLYFYQYIVYNQGFVCLTIYCIYYITLGIPLQLSQVLLGYYSKNGFLTVWKICPIMQGFGFTMIFFNLNQIVITILHLFYVVKYLLLGLQARPPYADCHERKDCNELSHFVNKTCCKNIEWFIGDNFNCTEHVTFPAWSYYREVILGQMDEKQFNGFGALLQWDTLFWMPLILGVLYYLCKKGLDFFTLKRVGHLQIIFLFMCCLFGVSFLFYKGWNVFVKKFFKIEWGDAKKIFRLISTSFQMAIQNISFNSGVMISIGSYMEAQCSLQRDVLVASIIKLILQFIFFVVILLSACSLSSMFNVDVHCIVQIRNWDPLYVIVTQYISEVKFGLMLFSLVYFSVIIIMLMTFMIVQIIFITNGIMELFPKMNISRTYILFGSFAIITTYALIVHGPSVEFITSVLINTVHIQTTMIMVMLYSFFIFWGYGVNRLNDDLYFITNTKPSLYWKITWHILVPAVLILAPIVLYVDMHYSALNREQWIAALFLMILLNLPIIFAAVYQYFQALRANYMIKLIKPDPSWGPPQEELRIERQNFNPSAFIRHKEKHFVCHHHCLIKNNELKNLIIKSEENRRKFYSELRRNLNSGM